MDHLKRIEWLDKDEFIELWSGYSKDSSSVYFWDEILEWADPDTFGIDTLCFLGTWDCYAMDKNNVYYRWKKIEWVDSETFEVLKEWYAKDKTYVYYYSWFYNKRLEWVDFDTFQILSWGYSKDKNNVYFTLEKVEWADPENFEPY